MPRVTEETKGKKSTVRCPVVHNYMKDHRGWGHDIISYQAQDKGNGRMVGSCMGFRRGVLVGDYLLLQSTKDAHTFLKVTKINYSINPTDLFTADFERTDGPFIKFQEDVFPMNDYRMATRKQLIAVLNLLPVTIDWDPAQKLDLSKIYEELKLPAL